MLLHPPIDNLLEKTECKYALVCLISKRARDLLDARIETQSVTSARAVSSAANEIYSGEVIAAYEA